MKLGTWVGIAVLGAAMGGGCTKASDEHARGPAAARYEAGYQVLAAAEPPGDSLAVLLRFDHMEEAGLADDVDALMKIMPDHRRVFGDHGSAVQASFDVLYISTADATSLTASTLVARSRKPRVELEAMLAYPGAGVSFTDSAAGRVSALEPTQRLYWRDPRVYLIPQDPWIVLTNPANLGTMMDTPPGKAPAWLRAVPSLVSLEGPAGSGKLLATATTDDLPATATLPGAGEVPMPTSMIATATVKGEVVTLSGDMSFASEAHARAANDALAGLRKQLGAFNAVRDLVVRRKGAALYWRTRATTREVAMMVGLVANAVKPLFGAPAADPRRSYTPAPHPDHDAPLTPAP